MSIMGDDILWKKFMFDKNIQHEKLQLDCHTITGLMDIEWVYYFKSM